MGLVRLNKAGRIKLTELECRAEHSDWHPPLRAGFAILV
jgi:hypothetical protein